MSVISTIYLVDHNLKKTFKFQKKIISIGDVAERCLSMVPSLSPSDLRHYGVFCLPRFAGGIQTREGMWMLDPSRGLDSFDELMGQERFEFLQKRRKVRIMLRTGVEKAITLDVSVPVSALMEKIVTGMDLKEFENPSLVLKKPGQDIPLDATLSLREQRVRDEDVCELASKSSLGINLKMTWSGNVDGGTQFKIVRLDDTISGKDALRKTLRKFKNASFETVTAHGLFVPANDEFPVGTWIRAGTQLSQYNLKNRDIVEVRKKFRRLKVLDPGKEKGAKETSKLILIDDSLTVADLIRLVFQTHRAAGSSEYAYVLQNKRHVELLDVTKTIRDQGYTGEAQVGITHTTPLFGEARFRCGLELPDPDRPERAPRKYLMYIELPYYEGVISKKSPRSLKGWQKRWWVLKRDRLIYYKTRQDRSPISHIDVQLIERIELSNAGIQKQFHDTVFMVHTPYRVFPLMAASAKEAAEWVEHLERSRLLFAENPQFYARHMKGKKDGTGDEDEDDGDDVLLDEESLQEQKAHEVETVRQAAEQRRELETLENEEALNLGLTSFDLDVDDTGDDALFQRSLIPAYEYIIGQLNQGDVLDGERLEEQVYEVMSSGSMLCLMVRKGFPDSIAISEIEEEPDGGKLSSEQKLANWKLLNSASMEIGCALPENEREMLMNEAASDSWPRLHKILTWRLVESCVYGELSDLTVTESPQLAEFLGGGFDVSDTGSLSQRETLLKWANQQLSKSTCGFRMANFGIDLQDGEALLHLLHAIDDSTDLSILDNDDLNERAEYALKLARDMGATVCSVDDLVEGNEALNMALIGQLCRAHLKRVGHADVMAASEADFVGSFLGSSMDDFLGGDDGVSGSFELDWNDKPSETMQGLFALAGCPADISFDDDDPSSLVTGAQKFLDFMISSGVDLEGVEASELVEGKAVASHRVMWQIAKKRALAKVSPEEMDGLVELLRDTEEEEVLRTLSGEDLLLRWVDHILSQSPTDIHVAGFERGQLGESSIDVFACLLSQLFPEKCPASMFEGTQKEKADGIIAACKDVGVKMRLTARELLQETEKTNFLLCASLFHLAPPLVRSKDRLTRSERDLIAMHVNELLGDVGLSGEAGQFRSAANLITFAKMLAAAHPGSIDISEFKSGSDPISLAYNVNILTEAMRKLGIETDFINLADLTTGKAIAIDQLSLLVAKHSLLGHVSVRRNAALVELADDGGEEDIEDMDPEVLLNKWIMMQVGGKLDSVDQLDLDTLATLVASMGVFEGLDSQDPKTRADALLASLAKLGVQTGMTAEELIKGGSKRFSLMTAAALFRKNPMLQRNPARLYSSERSMVGTFVNALLGEDAIALGSSKSFITSSQSCYAYLKLVHAKHPVELGECPASGSLADNAQALLIALASLGIDTTDLDPEGIERGDTVSIDKMAWKAVTSVICSDFAADSVEGLVELCEDGEDEDVLESLKPLELLERWVRYHSGRAEWDLQSLAKTCVALDDDPSMARLKEICLDWKQETVDEASVLVMACIERKGIKVPFGAEELVVAHERVIQLALAALAQADPHMERNPDRLSKPERACVAGIARVLSGNDSISGLSAKEFLASFADGEVLSELLDILAPSEENAELAATIGALEPKERVAVQLESLGKQSIISEDEFLEGKAVAVDRVVYGVVSAAAEKMDVATRPELVELLLEEEEEAIDKMDYDELWKRWMMFHLRASSPEGEFVPEQLDELDLDVLAQVCRQVAPITVDVALLKEDQEPLKKAEGVLATLAGIGVDCGEQVPPEELAFCVNTRLLKLMSKAIMHEQLGLTQNVNRLTKTQRQALAYHLNFTLDEGQRCDGTNVSFLALCKEVTPLMNHLAVFYPDINAEELSTIEGIVETLNERGFHVDGSVPGRIAAGDVVAAHELIHMISVASMAMFTSIDDPAPLVELLQSGEEEEMLSILDAREVMSRWITAHTKSVELATLPRLCVLLQGLVEAGATAADGSSALKDIVSAIQLDKEPIELAKVVVSACKALGIDWPFDAADIANDPDRMFPFVTAALFEKCPFGPPVHPNRLTRDERDTIATVINDVCGPGALAGDAGSFVTSVSSFRIPLQFLHAAFPDDETGLPSEGLVGVSAEENRAIFEMALDQMGVQFTTVDFDNVMAGDTVSIDHFMVELAMLKGKRESDKILTEMNEALAVESEVEVSSVEELRDLRAVHSLARMILPDLGEYATVEQAAADIVAAWESCGVSSTVSVADLLGTGRKLNAALLALQFILPRAMEAQEQAAEEAAIAAAEQFAEEAEEAEEEIESLFEDNIDRSPVDPALSRTLLLCMRRSLRSVGKVEICNMAEVVEEVGTTGSNREMVIAARMALAWTILINHAMPNTIDLRVVNLNRTREALEENLNLVLESARAIGCAMGTVSVTDLVEGKAKPATDFVWGVMRFVLLSHVQLHQHPELCQVMMGKKGELIVGSAQDIIVRFINFVLHSAGCEKTVTNLAEAFKDGVSLGVSLGVLIPQHCNFKVSDMIEGKGDFDTPEKRADACIVTLRSFLKDDLVLQASDILSSHPRVNLLFWAEFVHRISSVALFESIAEQKRLRLAEQERKRIEELEKVNAAEAARAREKAEQERIKAEEEAARRRAAYDPSKVLDQYSKMVAGMQEDNREQRAFKVWMSALGVEDVKDLIGGSRSGVVLIRLLDKMSAGSVDWKKVKRRPANMYQRVDNCNYVVATCQKLKMKLVSIGGKDIADGSKKHILAVIWQMWRFHIVSYLKLELGKEIRDEDILRWANDKVKSLGKNTKPITKFDDRSLKNGLFLIDLMSAMHPDAVNEDYVAEGKTKEEQQLNARYVISIARKLGYSVFALWEDINEARASLIFQFIAALMTGEEKRRKAEGGEG